MTVYGYARVSSKGQERDGNGLEVQRRQLERAGCERIVSEAYTGTRMDRPALDALIAALEPGDTFVATKLDRIARTSSGGCDLVRSLIERGVTVRVLNMGTIEDTPMGRMMMTVMFAMAEFDRDMVVQRLADGKDVARQRPGFREGRPEKAVPAEDVRRCKAAVDAGEMTVKQVCAELGVGRTKWYQLRKAA